VDLIELYIVSLKEKTNLLIVVIVARVIFVSMAEKIDFAQGGKMGQLGKTHINVKKNGGILRILHKDSGCTHFIRWFYFRFQSKL
jgi:hypothetical protein